MSQFKSHPMMESIEGRRLMSVTALTAATEFYLEPVLPPTYVSNGTLFVNGSVYEDIITVWQDPWSITVNNSGYISSHPTWTVNTIQITGGDGDDRVFVRPEVTKATNIFGGRGNDNLIGGNGVDYIRGEDGNDTIEGFGANDYLIGGNGNDYMTGGYGDDYIAGEAGADKMYGQAGNDNLFAKGDGSADLVDGGDGWDTAWVDRAPVRIAYYSFSTSLVSTTSYLTPTDSVYGCETVYT
jgi:Ca2+-binding RTX toxin-like protein